MNALQGKVALVTGSSRGIGRAIAEQLAAEGATTVVTFHQKAEVGEQVVRGILQAGGRASAAHLDVRDLASIRELFKSIQSEHGGIDILVNNAAGTNVFAPTSAMTEKDYDAMFSATRGVYFALQQAAIHLRDGGRIISISTGGTAMSMAGAGAYAGSKAAIEQFSMALAKELGVRQITVNTVLPGVTATDGLVLGPEQLGYLTAQTPLGRLGRPADIARVVAWLASPDAGWITGQNIRATGGIV